MRIGLLSSFESLRGDSTALRSHCRIAGRSVLQRQLELALSLGCEKIACLANGLPGELIVLQQQCERAGARFHAIPDMRPLSGLISAADEVLVLADGVLVDDNVVRVALGAKRAVLTFAADPAVAAGFERIDRSRAWAGAMLVGGGLIERLVDMPPDIDPHSSLLRLALQQGVADEALPDELIADGRWSMVDSAMAARAAENGWIARAVQLAPFTAPVAALAERGALAVLRRHERPAMVGGLGEGLDWISLAGAAFLGWQGWFGAAIGALAIGGFSRSFSAKLASLVAGESGVSRFTQWRRSTAGWIGDILLAGLVVFAGPVFEREESLFALLILFGLVRLGRAAGPLHWSSWLAQALADRGFLAVILALACHYGFSLEGVQLLALAALVHPLLATKPSRLTRA